MRNAASRLEEVLAGSPRLVAVAVEISEPGNAGTLIRIADAMGAGGGDLGGHSVDPYNGKCLRASAGSIFSIPVVVAPDVGAAVTALRAAGLQVLATTVDGELSPRRGRRLLAADGVAVRARIARLVRRIAAAADHRVRIPMSGGAREPECGCRRGDLPVPERAGAGCASAPLVA